jgi:hypothetical protein
MENIPLAENTPAGIISIVILKKGPGMLFFSGLAYFQNNCFFYDR